MICLTLFIFPLEVSSLLNTAYLLCLSSWDPFTCLMKGSSWTHFLNTSPPSSYSSFYILPISSLLKMLIPSWIPSVPISLPSAQKLTLIFRHVFIACCTFPSGWLKVFWSSTEFFILSYYSALLILSKLVIPNGCLFQGLISFYLELLQTSLFSLKLNTLFNIKICLFYSFV